MRSPMNCRSKRSGAAHRRRLLRCERLEPRHLLASDGLDGLDALDDLTFVPDDLGNSVADISDDLSSVDTNVDSGAESPDTTLDDSASDADTPAAPPPRHNSIDPMDVDLSGTLEPRDALLVIDHINYGDPSLTDASDDSAPGVFDTDVNGDGQITVADVQQVIDAINAIAASKGGEAETMALMALPPSPIPSGDAALPFITKAEVDNLLARAAGATTSEDAVIAVVDRGGNILGVRMEQGVLNNIPDPLTQVFAIDGAVAKARTAAFFANNQAPLTSRTIRSLSQSTITE